LLSTIIEEGPKALAEPNNYGVRATLMWCATQALNGTISRGVPQDWTTHVIGQELTALYGIDHAASLAIVLFGLWDNQYPNKKEKLAQFGRRVWNLAGSDDVAARGAIAQTEAFFRSLGMPTRLSEHALQASEVAHTLANRYAERGLKCLGEREAVGVEQIRSILVARA
jgi:NADP-dependent alcohol dehydrogenase